jgi:hypothetical protein
MEQKITTIEELAALMVQAMASKEDIQGLATKGDLQELRGEMNGRFERGDARFETIEGRLDHLDARMGRIEADVHALRDEMVHRRECDDVLDRVTYIEKTLGIESGVSRTPSRPTTKAATSGRLLLSLHQFPSPARFPASQAHGRCWGARHHGMAR